MSCSPSSGNYSSHFTGGLLWLWPAAPRPGPGLSSLLPQESPQSKSPQPPTSHPPHTHTHPEVEVGVRLSAAWLSASWAPPQTCSGFSTGPPPSPGWGGWGGGGDKAGTSPLNFPPPPSASEGSSLDPGPARMKRRASPPFGPAPGGSQIQRAGRKCPG